VFTASDYRVILGGHFTNTFNVGHIFLLPFRGWCHLSGFISTGLDCASKHFRVTLLLAFKTKAIKH
jgi:hypothetical protein